jgi:uracil-DNA glycosylase
MSEFDHGPSASLARLFDEVPDPPNKEVDFWFDWGPVFYRGRLDGSARLLCIASDPGPTERIAGRTLVGDAGQRVQGFLTKLGLTHSYVCVNAWPYAFYPTHGKKGVEDALKDEAQLAWRNKFYDAVSGPELQAVVVFGYMAKAAVELWKLPPGAKRFDLFHPSYDKEDRLVKQWREAMPKLREAVTPDADGSNTGPNYGASFEESDYAAIPRRDLPFGAPSFFGDDAWVRALPGSAHNSVGRSSPDDGHTLIWKAPKA